MFTTVSFAQAPYTIHHPSIDKMRAVGITTVSVTPVTKWHKATCD